MEISEGICIILYNSIWENHRTNKGFSSKPCLIAGKPMLDNRIDLRLVFRAETHPQMMDFPMFHVASEGTGGF